MFIRKVIFVCICWCASQTTMFAQLPFREIYTTWEDFLDYYTDDQELPDEVIDNLYTLKDEPINLNTTDKETLLQLPFLSESQIDSLIAYRKLKRKFLTLGELQFISGWDIQSRRFTSLFTYVGDTLQSRTSYLRQLTQGKHHIESRLDVPTYTRKGERLEKSGYQGNGLKNITRYRYSYKNRIKYGATFEKDAGEPFGTQGNNPFDYNSFYFSHTTSNKKHNFILGDYTLHIGEGLLLGRSTFAGQLNLLRSTARKSIHASPHTGTNEHNYFTGICYTYFSKKIKLTAFASYRKLDAKINHGKAETLYTDGLHRTYNELKHKNKLGNATTGLFTTFNLNTLHIGLGGYISYYEKAITPQKRDYNKYAFSGNLVIGSNLSYSYQPCKNLKMKGELSFDKSLHLAYSHQTLYKLKDNLHLVSQFRWFSKRYHSPFAQTINYASKVANEQGVMLGTKWSFMKGWNLETYIDAHRFPFSTYRATGSSQGIKLYSQITRTTAFNHTTLLRYTYNLWQENYKGKKSQLIYEGKHRIRIQHSLNLPQWSLTGLAEGCVTHSQVKTSHYGYTLAIRGSYSPTPNFSNGIFGSIFNTDNYETSVYAYEPMLPGMYSFGALYYKGFRIALQSKYTYHKRYTFGLRYGLTHYFNRSKIGSDMQEINSSSKGDFNIYLKLTF